MLAELGRLVPMYEELRQSSKVNLLQSLVSRLLVELVFDVYFVGLPRDVARQFTQMETFLAAFGMSIASPGHTEVMADLLTAEQRNRRGRSTSGGH